MWPCEVCVEIRREVTDEQASFLTTLTEEGRRQVVKAHGCHISYTRKQGVVLESQAASVCQVGVQAPRMS